MGTANVQRRRVLPWLAGIGCAALAMLAVLPAQPAGAAPQSTSVINAGSLPVSTSAASLGLTVPGLPAPKLPLAPVKVTVPPVGVSVPPVEVSLPPVGVSLPPVEVSLPPVEVSLPPVEVSLPLAKVSLPSITLAAPTGQPDPSQRGGPASQPGDAPPSRPVAAKPGHRASLGIGPERRLAALPDPNGSATGLTPNSTGIVQIPGERGNGVLSRRPVASANNGPSLAAPMSLLSVLLAIIAILALSLITAADARRVVLHPGNGN